MRGQDLPHHQALVAVQDSCIGIDQENADRLFDAFFTTSGMGMGLSGCRSISEARGERLWASCNVSPGANFQFTLPPHRVSGNRTMISQHRKKAS